MNYRTTPRLCLFSLFSCLCQVAPNFTVAATQSQKQGQAPNEEHLKIEVYDYAKIQPTDPLSYLNTTPDAPIGWIAYTANVAVSGVNVLGEPYFLILRPVGQTEAKSRAPLAFRVFPPVTEYVFPCQFSPNAMTVLFGTGCPYTGLSYYHPWLLNLRTRRLLRGPDELHHEEVYWSRDSRHFVCLEGGDSEGHASNYFGKPKLVVFDVETAKSKSLMEDTHLLRPAWTPQNTLLYTAQAQQATNKPAFRHSKSHLHSPAAISAPYSEDEEAAPPRTSIYEAVFPDGKHTQIIRDAASPVPSPDGKWIAFYRATNSVTPPRQYTKKQTQTDGQEEPASSQAGLYLYERTTKQQTLLRAGAPPFKLWLPDSHRLLLVASQGDEHGSITAHIGVFSLKTKVITPVTVLKTKPYIEHGKTVAALKFHVIGLSPDGLWLCLEMQEYSAPQEGFYHVTRFLQAVNLRTGKIVLLAKITNFMGSSLGLDFHFGSLPTALPE